LPFYISAYTTLNELLAIFLYIDNMKMKRIFEVRQISHDTGQATDFVQAGGIGSQVP